jgi:hypothetical protein
MYWRCLGARMILACDFRLGCIAWEGMASGMDMGGWRGRHLRLGLDVFWCRETLPGVDSGKHDSHAAGFLGPGVCRPMDAFQQMIEA